MICDGIIIIIIPSTVMCVCGLNIYFSPPRSFENFVLKFPHIFCRLRE